MAVRDRWDMVALNAEIKETFGKVKLFPVATSSKAGVPNVAPIAFVKLIDDDTIWMADNYMNKTLANLKENPQAAFYIWDADNRKCFQVRGSTEIKTSGPDYDMMKKMVIEKKPDAPAKSLVIMKVTEAFSCLPGPGAGKKVV
jgi:predicted pyridoxine 5'-phosphate oxidase superfamily flavin-nucleotide-binding protein